MEREDGEMSDDNTMLVDEDPFEHSKDADVKNVRMEEENSHTLVFKAEKESLVIKELEKVDASKLEERAKRFGLNLTGNRIITQRQIDELYANFGVEGNERHFRFDAIYLNGVDGLTTREIFEYLEDYKPLSLEWIDEVSCNVVCQDHISAALALLLHSREIKNEELKQMLSVKSSHHWREGLPHPKKDLILMRFATNGEKKKLIKKPEPKNFGEYYAEAMNSISKNPWGDLCQTWGVYDHQEVFQRKLPKNDYEDEIEEEPRQPPIHIRNKKLAMRLGKRKQEINYNTDDSGSDSEWKSKSKAPRMRMHADDEESKLKKKQASKLPEDVKTRKTQRDKYAPLSIEVVNTRSDYVKREPTRLSDKFKFHGGNSNQSNIHPSSVRSRLGTKVVRHHQSLSESEESNDASSNESFEVNLTSKVQKVSGKLSNSTNVWSRLDTKRNSSSSRSDLRQILKSKAPVENSKPKSTNDLRDKLGKSKQANLRIEIDNNYLSN